MENQTFFEHILYVIFGQIIIADRIVLVLLFLGALLLSTQKYFNWGRKFIIISTVNLLIIISPLPRWIVTYLENYYKRIEIIPNDVTGIIVLAGYHDIDISNARQYTAYNLCGGRIIQALELIHQNPNLNIIFAGGALKSKGGISESIMNRNLINNLIFDKSNIIYEDKSKSTIGNAQMVAEMIKSKPQEKWLLVTSAFHMARSVGLFRHQGFTIVPYPVDYHTTGYYDWHINSLAENLLLWRIMTNEILGMLRNWLFNHSDRIWPAKVDY